MNLISLQDFIAAAINGDETLRLAGVKAVAEDTGDQFREIQTAVGKLGVVAIVGMPKWTATSSAAKSVVGTATVQVDVCEVVSLNRRRPGALHGYDVSERIAYLLNMSAPSPGESVLAVQSITPGVNQDGSGVVYSVPFIFEYHLKSPKPQGA